MNRVSLEFNRGFYRRPRGGYPIPNPGAVNTRAPKVVVRLKGSKVYRPAKHSA